MRTPPRGRAQSRARRRAPATGDEYILRMASLRLLRPTGIKNIGQTRKSFPLTPRARRLL
jgi:hypothetical protein